MVSKNSFWKDEVYIGNRYLFPDKINKLEEKRSKKLKSRKRKIQSEVQIQEKVRFRLTIDISF